MLHQSYAYGKNHWLLEPDLKHILLQYWEGLPKCEERLTSFAILAGTRAYEIADYIDHEATPYLVMHDLNGVRVDRVRLCPAHADLLKELAPINQPPYHGGSWYGHSAG